MIDNQYSISKDITLAILISTVLLVLSHIDPSSVQPHCLAGEFVIASLSEDFAENLVHYGGDVPRVAFQWVG